VQEHRRAGWYGIGGTLSGLAALWLVGWAIAVSQSSPPHKLHYLVPVTYIAIALFVAGLVLVLAIMYDWPVWLVSRLPRLARLPLKVTVVDHNWESYQHTVLIGAFRVRIKNTTDKPIRVSGIGFQSDNRGLPSWHTTMTGDQALPIERELHRRKEASQNGNPLRNFSVVEARETISGWVIEAVTRDAGGGTPNVAITIRDELGNQYQATVDRTEPRRP
jgi:hypothetical protein